MRPLLMLLLPLAAGGCGLFGGGDDEKEDEQGSYMEGSDQRPAAPSDSTESHAAPPSKALPIGALLLSGLTAVVLAVHLLRRHPRPASGP